MKSKFRFYETEWLTPSPNIKNGGTSCSVENLNFYKGSVSATKEEKKLKFWKKKWKIENNSICSDFFF